MTYGFLDETNPSLASALRWDIQRAREKVSPS